LEEREFDRYGRHILLPDFGEDGQARISSSTAVVVGCGGLGGTIAGLLVRAGVGTVVIVDDDLVEISNLHRQVLFRELDLGRSKAEAAAEHLGQMNSLVGVIPKALRVDGSNIEALIDGADIVLDGSDNMETRFVINDACVKHGIPWIYGGAVATNGMSMTVVPGRTPCLTCVFKTLPRPGSLPTGSKVGVLSTVPYVMGSIQATEALKVLLGLEPRPGLMNIDLWTGDHRVIETSIDEACPTCQGRDFKYLL
jgi:adenylyltransferase/sulfurtransferase